MKVTTVTYLHDPQTDQPPQTLFLEIDDVLVGPTGPTEAVVSGRVGPFADLDGSMITAWLSYLDENDNPQRANPSGPIALAPDPALAYPFAQDFVCRFAGLGNNLYLLTVQAVYRRGGRPWSNVVQQTIPVQVGPSHDVTVTINHPDSTPQPSTFPADGTYTPTTATVSTLVLDSNSGKHTATSFSFSNGTWNATYGPLAAGSYLFRAKATDNSVSPPVTATASQNFTVGG
jgi:hypothetical protein